MGYTVKQASAKTNLAAHVLRYYEKEGLLPRVRRSKSGIRHYSEDDLEWLGLICCLKNTGMSIKQIKEFVDLSIVGDSTLKERCEMLQGISGMWRRRSRICMSTLTRSPIKLRILRHNMSGILQMAHVKLPNWTREPAKSDRVIKV